VERGVFPGGCFFAHLLAEYDARRGPVHDQVVEIQRGWLALLEDLIETAKQQGELRRETDSGQLAFELYAALELANYLSTLNRDPSVIERGRAAVRGALASAAC
jgi:hypothetical protein